MTLIDALVYIIFFITVFGLLITIVIKGYKEIKVEMKKREIENERST